MTSIDIKWMALPQDKSAWIIIEYSCWLPNLVHLWHLRWSSSCSLIKVITDRMSGWSVWQKRYVLVILLLGKALKKVSLIDSKENGKNLRTGTHPYCWSTAKKLLAWSHIEWSYNWMIACSWLIERSR